MRTLPLELLDSILDLINSDCEKSPASPSSLIACSLVCKQWVPRTRYHLFACIRLFRNPGIDTVKPFLHLISSPLVTFTSSVREVRLYYQFTRGPGPRVSAGDIILLLSRAQIRPRRLHLNSEYRQLGVEDFKRYSFASVTHLELALSKQIPVGNLPAYLSLFDSLQSLSLTAHHRGRVSIDSFPTETVFPVQVHTLELNHWDSEVTQYLTSIVGSNALTSLTLTDCCTDSEDDPAVRLELSHLHALRHLHIHRTSDFQTPAATSVFRALAGICWAKLLETIEVTVDCFEFIRPARIRQWRDVDALLAATDPSPLWPQLCRVTVRACSGFTRPNSILQNDMPDDMTISRAVRQRMPLCDARKILVIV
ncbi:hypothetical protein C8R44DRAFT_820283 [Mycena epipterygia]|nr:hypothetical protein C8R44DRAFT_820283 [Mycena epipterygia]